MNHVSVIWSLQLSLKSGCEDGYIRAQLHRPRHAIQELYVLHLQGIINRIVMAASCFGYDFKLLNIVFLTNTSTTVSFQGMFQTEMLQIVSFQFEFIKVVGEDLEQHVRYMYIHKCMYIF